jgi:hypothetical protein
MSWRSFIFLGVIPANAGIHVALEPPKARWIDQLSLLKSASAFAGMTAVKSERPRKWSYALAIGWEKLLFYRTYVNQEKFSPDSSAPSRE